MISNRSLLIPVSLIAAVLVAAAMKAGAALMAPTVLALVTGIILSPAIGLLLRLGLPRAAAAGTILAIALLGLTVAALLIEPIIWRALERLPTIWYELQETLRQLQDMLRGLNEMTEDVAKAIDPEGDGNGNGEDAVALPTAIDAIALAPAIAAQLMIYTGVLFFFLFTRDSIYAWAAKVFSHDDDDEHLRMKQSFIAAEHMVSRYFITITLINGCLGLAVAAAMVAIGMAAPILWGMGAFALNFIPYLGPAIFACMLLLGGVVSFDGLMSVAPMAIYLCMNVTEGQFVTPSLVGKTLRMNPLLIFLSLVFFLWIWGPLGGFVAIPVLLWFLLITGLMKPLREHQKAAEIQNALEEEAAEAENNGGDASEGREVPAGQ